MSSEAEFCLLGPLVVRSGGNVVPVTQGKLRALLAALLLSANSVVPLDELIETLWGQDPPATARVGVQNYVMQLRRALGAAGTRIRTHPQGYLIQVRSDELDVVRFEDLVRDGRAADRDGDWPQAASRAAAALALWRGEPLADTGSDLLATVQVPRLTELRLQALEARIDADIHLGRHGDVISELRQLAAAEPLRERLHGLLMLALYRDGRQGEALAAYQHARATLADALGAEPGHGLQQLHLQILTADPALVVAERATASASAPAAVVPRELPSPVSHFTGRAAELAALTRLAQQPHARSSTLVISAIGGTAGVGKTALAVHWAHREAGRFPDGQLYVNLRGYDPDQPTPATDALAGFLASLGVPGPDIPADIEERAARYRSLLAGKQLLVLLDNAGSVEQVRPLLPGGPGCAVVVTSRDSLAGLVARDGAVRIDLDTLPMLEAVGLLHTLVGARVDADRSAAEALAEQCARLPLALRVAAELAVARPAVPLADLVAELAESHQRLDRLDAGGDPRTSVRAVFSWSYRNLDAGPARAFRLAGLHPGPDFNDYAIAALTDSTLTAARRHLDVLARAHLVVVSPPDRYTLHDLLRAYARELAMAEDSDNERRTALTRLLDYFLQAAATAMDTAYPARRHRRPRIPADSAVVPAFAEESAARSWLHSEELNLVAVATLAADSGWPRHATRLAATLFHHMMGTSSRYEMTLHSTGLRAARRLDDREAAAEALVGIGSANWRSGRYGDAIEALRQALTLFREAGDRTGQARVMHNLGAVSVVQGTFQDARDYARSSLELFRQTGDVPGEAAALSTLGNALLYLGHYDEALLHYEAGLALCREIDDGEKEAIVLGNLGAVAEKQGRFRQAAEYHQQALELFRELGRRGSEANALSNLGVAARLTGRYEQAVSYHLQAIALCREVGERSIEAAALNGLGETLLAAGLAAEGRSSLDTALGIARQVGDRYEEARAHRGLGGASLAMDSLDETREHWRLAVDLYEETGAREAEEVRAQLAELDAAPSAATATASEPS